jgi:hypothetical protein
MFEMLFKQKHTTKSENMRMSLFQTPMRLKDDMEALKLLLTELAIFPSSLPIVIHYKSQIFFHSHLFS